MKYNGKEVLRKTSCSNVTAQVVVNEPNSWIYCAVEQEGMLYIVCGRDILANRMFVSFFLLLLLSLHYGGI